jgi:MFS family permease
MYSAAALIYFTRILQIPVVEIGLALSVPGVVGLLVSVPFGKMVDRAGARRASVAMQLAKAALMALLAVTQSFPLLLVVVAMLGAVNRGSQIAWQALVADVAGPSERVRVQALTRTAFNIGVSVGILIAAPVITANDRAPFTAMLIGVAICYLAVSQVTLCLPTPHQAVTSETGSGRPARPSPSYILLGLVTGFLALHISILEIAMPLWVTQETGVPRSVVSALLMVNTLLVVGLQVRASKSSGSVRGATVALSVSGLVVGASCLVFSITRGQAGWPALSLLVLATGLLTLGEMLQSAASWGLAYELAPEGGRGGHLGAFSIGAALQDVLGPGLVTLVVFRHVPAGWWLLAVALVGCGAIAVPLAGSAKRQVGFNSPIGIGSRTS